MQALRSKRVTPLGTIILTCMDIWSHSSHGKQPEHQGLPLGESTLWLFTLDIDWKPLFILSVSGPKPIWCIFSNWWLCGPLLLIRVSFSGEWLLISMTYPPKDPWGFPGGPVGKESACSAGDHLHCRRCRFNPWVRRSPGEGHGTPFQYSCLENPIGRGVWWATVHGGHKSWTRLSDNHQTTKQPVF